jgi:asparagine synthase (glutamine-hydrolysing)
MVQCIAGVVHSSTFHIHQLIDPMLAIAEGATTHKKQIFKHKNITLGSFFPNLLSDLKSGIHVICNGKLENSKELIHDLELEEGTPQLQILLKAYLKWGVESFSKLIGPMSIVFFDLNSNHLFLVRDRVGEHPIFWYQNHHYFIFSSNIKSLLSTGIIPQEIAEDAISNYLYLGYIPQDISSIKGVNKLLPAHFLNYNLNGGLSVHSYWSYSETFSKKDSKTGSKGFPYQYQELLKESIKIKIAPFYNCSTSLFLRHNITGAILDKELKEQKTKTYYSCIEHPFTKKEESVETLSIEGKELANDLVRMIWFLGEPSSQNSLPYYWDFYKNSQSKGGVLFSSCGGDLLLGACVRYYSSKLKRSLQTKHTPSFFRKLYLSLLHLQGNTVYFKDLRRANTNPVQLSYLEKIADFSNKELKQVSPYLYKSFTPEVLIQKFFHIYHKCSDSVGHAYFDLKTMLVDSYLSPIQNIAQACDSQVSFPFLYTPLIEYIASQQYSSDQEEKPPTHLVNQILEHYFPLENSFTSHQWKENNLLEFLLKSPWPSIMEQLPYGVLVESGYLSRQFLKRKISKKPYSERTLKQLWSILCLEVWYKLFIYKPLPLSPPDIPLEDFLNSK